MINRKTLRRALCAAVVMVCWINAIPAFATSGYGVGVESVPAAGVANAGSAAAALDASTIYFNPAGMSALTHSELMVGGQFILPTIHFTDRGSTIVTGAPLSGTADGHGGRFAFVPDIYLTTAVSKRLHIGLGINGPWGLVTDYKPTWIGRYNAVTTSLRIANVNPAVSYDIGNGLSIGAGFDIQYAKAELRQAIDFGTVCVGAIGPAVCSAAFGLAPQQNDGFGIARGNTWGYGYNIGVLYQATPHLRLGAHFRSHVKLSFNGPASFQVPPNARAFLTVAGLPGAFTDGRSTTTLIVPEQVSGSVYYKVDPHWAVMADLTWTRWSRLNVVRIVFDSPQTPNSVLQFHWKDVYRLSVGTIYDGPTYALRAGLAYDQGPTRDDFREPGIPDSSRIVAAVGASLKISERLTLDASYQHWFFKGGVTRSVSATQSVLRGNLDVSANLLGLGIRWNY